MMRVLDWLLGREKSKPFLLKGYWCDTPITLTKRITTPLGGRVTLVRFCVDIKYSLRNDHVKLHRVKLSRGGGVLSGLSSSINVAAVRRGEVWYVSSFRPESALFAAVKSDYANHKSELHRIIRNQRHYLNHETKVHSLVNALNRTASAKEIEEYIQASDREIDMSFRYTKQNGASEIRRVSVRGIKGSSLGAIDWKDQKFKYFRLDRIAKARPLD